MNGKQLFVAVVIFSAFIVIAGALQLKGGDWTSLTLNNNDTRYQVNSTINASNANQLIPAWNIITGNSITSTPIVGDGNVYFSDWGGYVYSANVLTGSLNWKENLGGAISSTPLLDNGTLYISLGPDGTADTGLEGNALVGQISTVVFALNASTGHVIWFDNLNKTTKMDAIWASPIVYKNLLYIGVASQGDESETSWKGQLYALNTNDGSIVWNNTVAGPDGGDGVWSSMAIDPALNDIYFGTGNPFGQVNTTPSTNAMDIQAANTLVLNLSGSYSWISPQNPLLINISGTDVNRYSKSNKVQATPGNLENQTFVVTSNATIQNLTTTGGNFYNIKSILLESNTPTNPRVPNPSINATITENYLGYVHNSMPSANAVDSISASSSSDNTLYGYSVMALNATSGQMVWYNQICKSGLPICGDNDFGSTPNLFSLTTNMTNCSAPCSAVGLGSKNGIYYVYNRVNGDFIQQFPIGTSESEEINPDGGIIGLAGMTNSTNPEIFVPSYYDLSPSVQGIVVAIDATTGESPWRFNAKGIVDGSVTVVPGAVIFGDVNGYLYILNSSNGGVILQTNFQNSVDGGVTSAEGHIFVPTSFGPSATAGLYVFALPASISNTTTISTTSTTTTSTSTTSTSTIPSNNNVSINETFSETGLPTGALWSVHYPLNNNLTAIASDDIIYISNSEVFTNQFSVQTVAFNGIQYAPTVFNGTVASNNSTTYLYFTPIGSVTSTTTSSTTTISSGGGGGSTGGGGGGGGGGSSKPVITNVSKGYNVTNVAALNTFNLTLCGTKLDATENFITPTTAGIAVNGQLYTLSIGQQTQLLGFPSGCSVELLNISYLPIEHTTSFLFLKNAAVANGTNTTNTLKQINVSFTATANGAISISAGNYTPLVKITSVSAETPNAPVGFTKLSVYNISAANGLNAGSLNITTNIQCTSSAIKPFILENNTWNEITEFSVNTNSSSCSISFIIPADPIVALMQAGPAKSPPPLQQTGNSTATSTILANTTATGAPTNNKTSYGPDLLIGIGLVIIIAFVVLTSRKTYSKEKRKETLQKNRMRKKNGNSKMR